MSDPVLKWITGFMANLDAITGEDDPAVQRKAILKMIQAGEDEMQQLDEMMDQIDDLSSLVVFVELMAHASASHAMFSQALIHFDRKHRSPKKIGNWTRGGTKGKGDEDTCLL